MTTEAITQRVTRSVAMKSQAIINETAFVEIQEHYPPHLIEGSTFTTDKLWEEVVDKLQRKYSKTFDSRLGALDRSHLLAQHGAFAFVVGLDSIDVETLQGYWDPLIEAHLSRALRRPIQCHYINLQEAFKS